ncbi:fibrous sheath CABYR-binding protein-like [Schistocerca piceifrons]|uniref:fibrous sheath CABYR-binding protein-like n=1 Tax=Schistocerca piceifrons TaxID=274613 RepID=UPI001F5E37F4|nr:fibrous sheath CABYR-binding protein-like [Schistocerca piceifrons]
MPLTYVAAARGAAVPFPAVTDPPAASQEPAMLQDAPVVDQSVRPASDAPSPDVSAHVEPPRTVVMDVVSDVTPETGADSETPSVGQSQPSDAEEAHTSRHQQKKRKKQRTAPPDAGEAARPYREKATRIAQTQRGTPATSSVTDQAPTQREAIPPGHCGVDACSATPMDLPRQDREDSSAGKEQDIAAAKRKLEQASEQLPQRPRKYSVPSQPAVTSCGGQAEATQSSGDARPPPPPDSHSPWWQQQEDEGGQ